MEVVLEPLDEQQPPSEAAEPAADTAAAAPPPAALAEPAKRPRGRPKGFVNRPKPSMKQSSPKKPKKQKRPPSTSSESSESDDPPPRQSKRAVVGHLGEDDVEIPVSQIPECPQAEPGAATQITVA